ncbi:MAG TPA: hypothetical protein DEP05_02975 [Betaproteobacteria bacterium]|nr:hypothetical protein [Betaproteobacteria bacterium]
MSLLQPARFPMGGHQIGAMGRRPDSLQPVPLRTFVILENAAACRYPGCRSSPGRVNLGWFVNLALIAATIMLAILLAYAFIPFTRVENE